MQIAVRVATVGKECNSHEALWTKSREQDADDVKSGPLRRLAYQT